MTEQDETLTIAFDLKKMKVGCPIIQAILLTTISNRDVSAYFDVDSWEIGDPSGMRVYPIKRSELAILSERVAHVRAIEKTWEEK